MTKRQSSRQSNQKERTSYNRTSTIKIKLSVIIASVNGPTILKECLDHLSGQLDKKYFQVVVASRCGESVSSVIQKDYTWVHLVEANSATPIPQLRALAFREATGEIIAVLEDHCMVASDWAQQVLLAHQADRPVIGGVVQNGACERLVDWAAFFCEYSQVMPPLFEGETENIAGNNVSYKRWVIKRFWDCIAQGEWDWILHEQIKKEKILLFITPAIIVNHKLSASLGWFLSQKYHFARSFAGTRLKKATWWWRALYGFGAFLLPFLLIKRITSHVWRGKTYRQEFLLSFPLLWLLLMSWYVGEVCGYFWGEGSSPAKVC